MVFAFTWNFFSHLYSSIFTFHYWTSSLNPSSWLHYRTGHWTLEITVALIDITINYNLTVWHYKKCPQAYPVSTWSERPSDTPLRTIKTVIYTLSKAYGHSILGHFSKIDNSQSSELHKYLTKSLKVSAGVWAAQSL